MGELFVSYTQYTENSLFRVFPLIYLHSCFVRICWLMSPSLLPPAAAMALFFSDSRDSLVETMRAAYSTRFDRYVNIFDDFYDYLRDAMYTGSICEIGSKFMQVNFEVFLAAFLGGDSGAQSVELLKSAAYRTCFYDNFVNLYSSELSITYSFRHFTNILNRTMHYMRALYISDHIIESVLSQGLTTQCRNAILKMTHCSQCAGHSSPASCSGLCLNTMRGCLVDLSDLAEPFRQFTQAVIWMKEQLEPLIDQFTLIQPHFLNVVKFVEIQGQAIATEVSHTPPSFIPWPHPYKRVALCPLLMHS